MPTYTQIFNILIAPVLSVIAYWFYKKRLDVISASWLSKSFASGVLAIVPILVLNLIIKDLEISPIGDISNRFTYSILISFLKEWSKYLVVVWFALSSPTFDEPYKGVAYTLMAAMGFACTENIIDTFFYENIQLMPIALSSVLYALSAVMVGYGLGRSKDYGASVLSNISGLVLAITFHGACLFAIIGHLDKLLVTNLLAAILIVSLELVRATKIREKALAFEAYAKSV
ncbi:Protease prsW family protein [Flexibacter flexilis DSM 6793]|uniref:Protease prsW family protein n=1 Tax=Flexibacter flexilis DSM 6793 TaxID=927664 RepID=A0A1I1N1U9_9BACT|nr:PrsW family glutamic-type intramembrane protease [Flexibacter flexilis]SFC91607.1 Protease prsW family protein [Flexibacter flexilis DSM 6793]